MSANKQVGSKLANSVRQAKVQQKQQAEQTSPAIPSVKKPAAPAAKQAEPQSHFISTSRVWPD